MILLAPGSRAIYYTLDDYPFVERRVETIFEIGSQDTQVVTFGDGDFEPAFGLFGGGPGTLNFIRLTYPDGTMMTPRNKDLIAGVPRGTTYHQQAGGGGGYGDPKKRDRAKLAEEVRDGLISPQADTARDFPLI